MEEWRYIPEYKGDYIVSNYGRIASLKYGRLHFMKLHTHKTKIVLVTLTKKGGSQKTYQVHRLVAKAFIPNPDNLPIINHKDANRSNNHYSNLEWCTQQQNVHHAIKMGLWSKKQKK